MHLPVADGDAFTEDLPAGIAVQYRILRKLLPRRNPQSGSTALLSPCSENIIRMKGARHDSSDNYDASTQLSVRDRTLPYTSRSFLGQPLAPSLMSSFSSCRSRDHWDEGTRAKVLREIELGGPILDQLLDMHSAHSRLRAELEQRWRDAWCTLAESESVQRRLIETMAGCLYDPRSPFVLCREALQHAADQSHRAAVAEMRMRELERSRKELWKYNEMLEECHGEAVRTHLRKEGVGAEKEDELRDARQTIETLTRKLREAETASRESLYTLVEDFKRLKAQYRDMVAAHRHTDPIAGGVKRKNRLSCEGEGEGESGGGGAAIVLLRKQVRELQHETALKRTTIDALQQEVSQLRDVAWELGISQAKVHTLECQLKAATALPH